MRLSPSDDDGELKELDEETKAAHLLVKAVETPQVNKFTNTLRMISSPFCTLSRVVYDFCIISCKMSQNVAFHIYLHVNRHYLCKALL